MDPDRSPRPGEPSSGSETLNRALSESAGMSDEEADEPVVELGEGPDVEGAPLARVSSRLSWPIQRSEIARLEGDTEIRTPEGPRRIAEVLESVEDTYFERRQQFEAAVRAVVGTGPVATAEE